MSEQQAGEAGAERYRIQIRMKIGWVDSLTWREIYSKQDAEDLVKVLNGSHANDWRAIPVGREQHPNASS